ncbi:MAG: cyclic pyranopterin monophosphate synthase MoaC [SAR324 cluster bacterium]|uniref:Cyclic pyranopterin monophosphate synthase n=1 Tax=SAR324 cluster bacterium TaxID=2024889 RepID=A0A2A4SNP3_9DELT|nr:MAG: cyclic pyranopterin monophosphate synthase MoaC [SAR324 cluster bacterium]
MEEKLSHFDEKTGRAKMVDVGGKQDTTRIAITRSILKISAKLVEILASGSLEKGDAFTVAKTAGILAAKQTGQLIPMCHPLSLDCVNIEIELLPDRQEIRIEAEAKTTGKTGVEMEALVAASVAGMTVYDMCKAVDKGIQIVKTGLFRKTGGKSGEYCNPEMEW